MNMETVINTCVNLLIVVSSVSGSALIAVFSYRMTKWIYFLGKKDWLDKVVDKAMERADKQIEEESK